MKTTNRRYDIDWLRIIAIALLLVYHAAIGFQSWGIMLGFVTTEKVWPSLWTPMSMLNTWRIPLLFFVSGMGVYFSMQSRNWKQLLTERSVRILLPYVFGMFAIVPISSYIWQRYNQFDTGYSYGAGHLWFLGNIFVYVIVLSPLFYFLINNEEGKIGLAIKRLCSTPFGLLPVVALLVAEAILVNPGLFTLYAETWHGFFFGFLAFFFGFCFVYSGESFWRMIAKWVWLFLPTAMALFIYRMLRPEVAAPNYLLMIESCLWIFSILALACKYLNHSSKALNYLSEAVLPVYILHMIFQALASAFVFSLDLPVELQFVMVLALTITGCFAVYEFVIRRINFIRPLFGLKLKHQTHSESQPKLMVTIS